MIIDRDCDYDYAVDNVVVDDNNNNIVVDENNDDDERMGSQIMECVYCQLC